MNPQDLIETGVTPSKELNQTLNTVRRSDRIKASDQNRSKYAGDPSHREFNTLIMPPQLGRSISVEQLVNHFDVSKGAVSKRNEVFTESVADQIRDCSISITHPSLRNKQVSFGPTHDPKSTLGQNIDSPRENLEFELEGAHALPNDVSAALQKALKLSHESHQAVTELGKSVKEDMVSFMREIMNVIEPLKNSLMQQNTHANTHHTPVEIQSVEQIQPFVEHQFVVPQVANQDMSQEQGSSSSKQNNLIVDRPLQNSSFNRLQDLPTQKTSNMSGHRSDSSRNNQRIPNPSPQYQLPTGNYPGMEGFQQQAGLQVPQASPGRRQPYGGNGSLQVSKWGLKFDGCRGGLHIDDFVFRIEHLQNMYNCSWNDVLRDFHLMVEGEARAWFWVFLSTNAKAGNRDIDWPILKRALAKRFKSSKSSYEVLQELLKRRQGATEPVDKYFLEMMTLLGRLEVPLPEVESVKLIKDNLNDSLKRIVYPIHIYNLEHLRDQCWEAERTFGRREDRPFAHQPNRNIPSRQISEVFYDEPVEEEVVVLDAVHYSQNTTNNGRKPFKTPAASGQQPPSVPLEGCWNCKQPGHFYRQCPATERCIFCYKCGLPKVVTPTCPNCNPKNLQKGSIMTG